MVAGSFLWWLVSASLLLVNTGFGLLLGWRLHIAVDRHRARLSKQQHKQLFLIAQEVLEAIDDTLEQHKAKAAVHRELGDLPSDVQRQLEALRAIVTKLKQIDEQLGTTLGGIHPKLRELNELLCES